jgi:oligopeptide/dipeptide ABC transporter ATP-binding protein
LDVSVRAEILNLLTEQRQQLGLAMLLIAHDLAVVEQTSDRVAVLYLGKIVEIAATNRLFGAAQHPYSVTLMASVPVADPSRRRIRIPLTGELPSPTEARTGCSFYPRCPIAQERCVREEPGLTQIAPGHHVACPFPGELVFEPSVSETLELSAP